MIGVYYVNIYRLIVKLWLVYNMLITFVKTTLIVLYSHASYINNICLHHNKIKQHLSFVYVFSFCSFLLGPQMLQFSSSWAAGYIVQFRMSFFFINIFQMSSSHSVRKIVLLVFPLFFLILLQIINKTKKK